MIHDIKVYPFHYAILAGWLSLASILLALSRFNQTLQLQTLLFMCMGYVVWGAVHHYIIRDLTAKIMLEYVLMAILVTVLFWGVFLRA